MGAKPWQIGVIVVGLLVGCVSVAWAVFGKPDVNVNMIIHCIDVETGDIYRIDAEKNPLILPARHPTNNRVTLIRLGKDEKGTWHVTGRDMQTLDMLEKDAKNIAVDENTGDIKTPVKAPIDYVRAK